VQNIVEDVGRPFSNVQEEMEIQATSSVEAKTPEGNPNDGEQQLITLQSIVNNRLELKHFRTFLADNFASDDLNCWLDVEALRGVADRLRPARVRLVVRKYFNDHYFYGLTSPASKHEQKKVVYSRLLKYFYSQI